MGMGQKLVQEFPEARMAMQEASEACGLDLLRLCLEGPAEELRRTANCQPAVLAVSAATLRVVQERTPVRPQLVAGHSLGEYTALVAADAVSGLLVACALVMPHRKLEEVKVSTVERKFKSKDFARGVDRSRVAMCEQLGLSLSEFFELSLEALKQVAGELGL